MVWRKFFSFEHPIADVPEIITDDFGEVTEPPPRQSKSEGKTSKKSKKNKRRKQQGTHNKTETKSDCGEQLSETKEVDVVETNVCKHESDKNTLDNESETASESAQIMQSDDTVNHIGKRDTDTIQKSELSIKDNANKEKEKTEIEGITEKGTELKKPRTRINPWDPQKPAFRVTCNRVGDKHNFDSMTAASNFGGAIYRYFGWNVEMKNFNIEVMLNIEDEEVTVCIGLTRESLHRRNIGNFGPTTLRPTLAYNMLR